MVNIWGLVGGLLLLAVPAFGQTSAKPVTEAEMTAALGREPALTQSDMDAYLEALPLLKSAEADREGRVAAVFAKAGLSETRSLYVVVKVAQAYTVLKFEAELGTEAAESYRASLEDPFKPTPGEVNLVRQSRDKLDAAMNTW